MNIIKRLNKVYEEAEIIPFDNSSRIVIMSDCHRGDGSVIDNFSKNQNICRVALNFYNKNKYTYFEVGDGDELWENRDYKKIMRVHGDIFDIMTKFYMDNRLYFMYGNHDINKRDPKFVKEHLYRYYDDRENRYISLFENVKVHEGLILNHKETGGNILLTHGHQGDFFNSTLWWVAKFLVAVFWKPLEAFGVQNPTSPAINSDKKKKVERNLIDWVTARKCPLICGHTHRSMFAEVGEPPYFNDGSLIHPRCITAIEIVEGNIVLVKWEVKAKEDGTLYIGKQTLAGPRKMSDYFNKGITTG